jgi:hypothetical protein
MSIDTQTVKQIGSQILGIYCLTLIIVFLFNLFAVNLVQSIVSIVTFLRSQSNKSQPTSTVDRDTYYNLINYPDELSVVI